MASQNTASGLLDDQMFDNLDIETRAQLAAKARVSTKDKDIYRRNQQAQPVVATTTLAPGKKDSLFNNTAVTNTVSKPKMKVENPTTITRSAVKSPSNRGQKVVRNSRKDPNLYDREIQPMDLSQDDTFHSDFLESPLMTKAGGLRSSPAKQSTDDEYQPHTPVYMQDLFNTLGRKMDGEVLLDEEEEEDDEDQISDEDDYEDEEDEPITKVFTPSLAQPHRRSIINQPATVQRPSQDRIIPQTLPAKQSYNPSLSSKTTGAILSGNSMARSAYQNRRVQFPQRSPSRSKTAIVPVYEAETPSRGNSVGIKRPRSDLHNDKIQSNVLATASTSPQNRKAGVRHVNPPVTSETTTVSKAEELRDMDYNTDELTKKTFVDLQSETFDHDPQRIVGELEQHFGENSNLAEMDLGDRLKRVYEADNVEVQGAFFDSLDIEEWEEAGDWIMDQFTDLMKRAKEARKAKRDIASKFEEEIAKRHETVEGRIEGTRKTMEEMKRSGQVVLQANSVAFGIKDDK